MSQKSWKIFLLVFLSGIFLFTIFYTNSVVRRIEKEEREKALLWVYAIRKKAALIKYTEDLFKRLEGEEKKKVELWALGVKKLISTRNLNEDLSFVFEVVKNNETVPVILTDENGNVISTRNLDPLRANDPAYLRTQIQIMKRQHPPIEIKILSKTRNYLYYKQSKIYSELRVIMNDLIKTFISEEIINTASVPVIYTDETGNSIIDYGNISLVSENRKKELFNLLEEMRSQHPPIRIDLPNGKVNYIFYKESELLTQLKFFPYFQFLALLIFLVLAYVLLSTSKRSEQNRVWVGMSKETAHQLGTPMSSLIAWIELLKAKHPDEIAVPEMHKDIERLQKITDRFSKIGSKPELIPTYLKSELEESIDYLKNRISKKVIFNLNLEEVRDVQVNINRQLFDWAIENICKNAVDAMVGNGKLEFNTEIQKDWVHIDISDTGKGIAKKNWKKIFEPGFTSKKRGWGLGLTLVKRIIQDYHNGKIFVKKSDIDEGTTFRISLKIA